MREEAERNIQKNWDFVFDRLYLPKTKLIYDYVTSDGKDGAIRHLASIEETLNSYPNPCGWSSGMENTDMSGGQMLEAVICRYDVTGDKSMKKYAEELYEGLMDNAAAGKDKGALPRGRHPADGVTHYVNSSRDQYTHWISAMLRYYHSDLCDDMKRESIKKILVEMAMKAERDVTAENDYCLLNEDGRPAIVCEMHRLNENLVWHEALRLPAFYMAAYSVTGDEHWLSQYKKNRDWSLDYAEEIKFERYKEVFALLQMQMSIKVLHDNEKDKAYAERYGKLMKKIAYAMENSVQKSREQLKGKIIPDKLIPWQDCQKEFISDSMINGYRVISYDVYNATSNGYFVPLRNGAEGVLIRLLCDDYNMSAEEIADFEDFASNDCVRHCADSVTTTAYCFTWWLLKSKIKEGTV